jgi:hypothetical protein
MSVQGLVLVGLVAVALILLVLDQVRRDRLYVGYGVVLVVAVLGVVGIAFVPILLRALTWTIGAALPGAALLLLSLTFILFVLVYVLTQVTIVANRVAAVVQELAIRGADAPATRAADDETSDRASP